MAEIIDFNKAVMERRDEEEGVFAARREDGELKDITDWDADDWQGLFEEVLIPVAMDNGVSIYELIAQFMRSVLSLDGAPEE